MLATIVDAFIIYQVICAQCIKLTQTHPELDDQLEIICETQKEILISVIKDSDYCVPIMLDDCEYWSTMSLEKFFELINA